MTAPRRTKGIFGAARAGGTPLPIAGRYPTPRSRRREIVVGLGMCAALAVVLAVAFLVRGSRIVARAPLSSHHATFEASCGSCHNPFGEVGDVGCLTCHERSGESGVFTLAAHAALHLAGDGDAPTTAPAPAPAPCASCHPEHHGREGAVIAAADSLCVGCHAVGSFSNGHPEFRFAREAIEEPPGFTFPHRSHVDRLVKDKGYDAPQEACLYCHRPLADGRGFAPLDFERGCGECHLTAATGTPRLPAGDPADPTPGVLTLDAIRASGRPLTRWSWFQNPDELRLAAGKVQKRPVYHADPWVLENLRRIRQVLYPDLGLAGLLETSVEAGSTADPAALAAEAMATLRSQVAELRSRPEPAVQAELRAAEALLAVAETRLRSGERPGLADFVVARPPDPALSSTRLADLEQLALDLTEPCRKCHVVSGAAILRVEKDQRTLHRAEFSHRAHLLLVPLCVDCHGAIPSLAVEKVETDDPADRAQTLNLPRIEACRSCHTAKLASESCTTCHRYHPGADHHLADLRLTPLRQEPPRQEGP